MISFFSFSYQLGCLLQCIFIRNHQNSGSWKPFNWYLLDYLALSFLILTSKRKCADNLCYNWKNVEVTVIYSLLKYAERYMSPITHNKRLPFCSLGIQVWVCVLLYFPDVRKPYCSLSCYVLFTSQQFTFIAWFLSFLQDEALAGEWWLLGRLNLWRGTENGSVTIISSFHYFCTIVFYKSANYAVLPFLLLDITSVVLYFQVM